VTPTQKIAYINLTSGEIKIESVPPDLRNRFIGGRGIDIYLLFSQLKPNTDPLNPDNVITVSTGLLSGTLASMSGRTNIMTKSPLSGYLGEENIGGFFAPELRMAGFDHLVITGKAAKPSFIMVCDGKIKIQDAGLTWGKTTPDTQEILRKELEDDDIQTVCIGPAGENQVKFASVMTRHQGANGRSGIGAVFGSKNLKAIVARGKKGIRIDNPAKALEYDRKIVANITSSEFGRKMQGFGVSSLDIPDDPFAEYTIGMDGCFGCQLHCRRRYVIRKGKYAGIYGQGPGYQARQAWEKILGKNQPEAVLVANYLVNSFAMDVQETAALIYWAMKLYDEGILTNDDTDGIDLDFGNAEAAFRMIDMMAHRVKLGNILAEGGVIAAGKIGKGAERYFPQIKGLADISDNHGFTPWQILGIATNNSGSDDFRFLPASDPSRLTGTLQNEIISKSMLYQGHTSSNYQNYDIIPWSVLWTRMCAMANDILGICDFHTVLYNPTFPGFEEFSTMINLNTGLNVSPTQIWQAAERSFTLERLFNLREGYSSINDLPDRWNITIENNNRMDLEKFKSMLDRCYEIYGWDSIGVPKAETLKRLDLDIEFDNKLRK
jgi:aldehyde:ferredoxin oxidoreductase